MDYDGTYHKLFSNPALVEDLMRHFVEEDWVAQLDFSTLERVNAKFHTDALDRREGDLIYRIHSFDGQPAYLYLLLEFQSRTDPWMAVRVMVYVGLLYQHLIREKQLNHYLNTQINALPKKMRQSFLLSRVAHLTNKEIAVKLASSESNVSQHVHNAIRILKNKLGSLL